MTFANIWVQITTRHQVFHASHEELRDRVSQLESLLHAHNIAVDDQHILT